MDYILHHLPIAVGTQLTDCWNWQAGAKLHWAIVDTESFDI
jgi:hypothetical protein